jgi:3-oxoacyl-[acyl-carrier protein] reductase
MQWSVLDKMKNKVAMITGAAVGIGRAVALQMAEKGAKLVLLDMNVETLKKLEEELKVYDTEVMACVCDVSDEKAVNDVVQSATEKFGGIDILVNNAALWRNFQAFLETPTETWEKFMDINVMSVVYCTKAVLPKMLENGYGRIVNVASVAGVYGNANMAAYSATKGAVIAMTKSLAKEVIGGGVVVNSVSPGTVSDSANPDIDHFTPTELSYIGRTGTDRENAELICFLASEKASYIVGQNIQIDGCRKKA